jgi:hypothetical protein
MAAVSAPREESAGRQGIVERARFQTRKEA